MRTLIIPAGGRQTRWLGPYPKHLAPILGTTVIERLYSQLAPSFDRVEVLAWHPDIIKIFPNAWMPEKNDTLHASLLGTKHLWSEYTVFAYGDCVLSKKAAKLVKECDKPIQFFGHFSEIMAIAFDNTMHERWAAALAKAMTWTDRRWATYRCFWGMPMAPISHDGGRKEFTHFGDWSTDIDEPQCMVNVLESIRIHGGA